MKYEHLTEGRFLNRPNRFLAKVELADETGVHEETVHVKNTGRLKELLLPGACVYLQDAGNTERKTRYDLVAVKKGQEIVSIDSMMPNALVKEWVLEGGVFSDVTYVKPEVTFGNSRFDLYVEHGEKKCFIEVKGVTLEMDGAAAFPDAPSERAVKHVNELIEAKCAGYEAMLIFVIQMANVRYFTPNRRAQAAFADALLEARKAGVTICAVTCEVSLAGIHIAKPVPVVLENPELFEATRAIADWYRKGHRDLPWRHLDPENRAQTAYHVWVSEIMLQQTRVEAVKPYYARFLRALPDVKALAEAPEDELLKLWEGLGYYNRIRNMQAAARQIQEEHGGVFPESYEEIRALKGIGNYTAGAISSFAYKVPKPAVDGNVLRVISRLTASFEDITRDSVKRKTEEILETFLPGEDPSDFNQGLIELGAVICAPGGEPKCDACPAALWCKARQEGIQMELPVKKKAKERRIEERTILLLRTPEGVFLGRRPGKGLLAGLYEFPSLDGSVSEEEATAYAEQNGLLIESVRKLPAAKHIFSHVEWHMTGYELWVKGIGQFELFEKKSGWILARYEELEKQYALPSAFAAYKKEL